MILISWDIPPQRFVASEWLEKNIYSNSLAIETTPQRNILSKVPLKVPILPQTTKTGDFIESKTSVFFNGNKLLASERINKNHHIITFTNCTTPETPKKDSPYESTQKLWNADHVTKQTNKQTNPWTDKDQDKSQHTHRHKVIKRKHNRNRTKKTIVTFPHKIQPQPPQKNNITFPTIIYDFIIFHPGCDKHRASLHQAPAAAYPPFPSYWDLAPTTATASRGRWEQRYVDWRNCPCSDILRCFYLDVPLEVRIKG